MRLFFLLPIALILAFGSAWGGETGSQGLIGFTYTQDNIFISSKEGSHIANIQIYGWGNYWPFPESGSESDNGAVIDKRIKQALNDGQEVMLTCATAPSIYRKSGKPWNMEERVMNSMEDQYAQRCAQAVLRWPQIRRVQVWNELKGYWLRPPANRWDYEGYTRFYNKVYHAVKSARSDVMVGGGYVALRAKGFRFDQPYDGVIIDSRSMDAIKYWIAHADGYDAICLDGQFPPEDFLKVTRMFRRMAPGKPIWWAEFYGDNSLDMREARHLIERDQHPGDIALWWAEKRFAW
jgi:hypothetical protein